MRSASELRDVTVTSPSRWRTANSSRRWPLGSRRARFSMSLTTRIVADVPHSADRPACVLIVDDERHNRELLEIMLKPEGFLLLTAASGEEALAMIARQPPDLILLDVMMPGMSGYDVAGNIKNDPATQNITVSMLTALEYPDTRILGLKARAEEFL